MRVLSLGLWLLYSLLLSSIDNSNLALVQAKPATNAQVDEFDLGANSDEELDGFDNGQAAVDKVNQAFAPDFSGGAP
jgi:hypothetical protein